MNNNETKAKNKSSAAWHIIMKRELASYFSSPIPYIVGVVFLLVAGFLFFPFFFIGNRAELREFFRMLPIEFSLFIPALTMRLFSEEKRSGSLETLMTLPVTTGDVVAGKYVAALIASLVLLLPTLFYAVTCCLFGGPDMGPIIGGYLGAIFLAASYTAVGLFASSSTNNQILAFFVAFAICAVLSMLSMFAVFLPGPVVSLVTFISATSHFDSISRGVIDTRDIIYFVSLTALFLTLTVRMIQNSRKG